MKTYLPALLGGLIVASAISMLAGCGGAQQAGGAEGCADQLSQILDKKEVCDSILFEDYASEVKSWQENCAKDAPESDRKTVAENFSRSNTCTKKQAEIKAQQAACEEKIIAIGNADQCEGQACEGPLGALEKILEECAAPELQSPAIAKGRILAEELKRKVEEQGKLTAALGRLAETCASVLKLVEEDQTAKALEQLISDLAANGDLAIEPSSGSPAEAVRTKPVSECNAAVTGAIGAYEATVATALKKSKKKASN